MASTYELIVQAVDKTSRPLGNIERSLGSLDKRANGVSRTLKAAGGALAAFATGNALRSITRITARYEDLQDTLNTVTGSIEDGGKAFAFVKKFATQTQFGVEELTTTFIKLKGAGITPTEKLLTTFTDTAAVTTDQIGTLTAMTDLFSRTTAGGLGLEELNRLADRGVPVFRILEEQLGLTRLEISEFGKTAEGAEKIRKALVTGLNNSFGGATQGKLDNLSTAMSNFQIAVKDAADTLGSEYRVELTKAINEATAFLTSNKELIQTIGVGLNEAIRGTSDAVKFLAANFDLIRKAMLTAIAITGAGSFVTLIGKINSATAGAKSLTGIMGGAGKAMLRFGKSIPVLGLFVSSIQTLTRLIPLMAVAAGPLALPFIAVATVVAGLTTAFYYLKDQVVTIGETTASIGEIGRAAFNLLKQSVVSAFNKIKEGINQLVQSDFVKKIVGKFVEGWNKVKEIATGAFNKIIDGINSLLDNPALVSFVNTMLNAWKTIAEYWYGGLLTLKDFFIRQFNRISDALAPWFKSIAESFSKIKDQAIESFAKIGGKIVEWATKAQEIFRGWYASVSEAFTKLVDVVRDALAGMGARVKTGVNFIINSFRVAGAYIGGIIKNIPVVWGKMIAFLGAKTDQFKYKFEAFGVSIQLIWQKVIKFLATKFADFVSETGSVFNQAAAMLGFDPVFDTMGIQAWASSFDGAIMRSENRLESLSNNASGAARRAAAIMDSVQILPDVDVAGMMDQDSIAGMIKGVKDFGTQVKLSVVDGFADAKAAFGDFADKSGITATFEAYRAVVNKELDLISSDFERNRSQVRGLLDSMIGEFTPEAAQRIQNLFNDVVETNFDSLSIKNLGQSLVDLVPPEAQKALEAEILRLRKLAEEADNAARLAKNLKDEELLMGMSVEGANNALKNQNDLLPKLTGNLGDVGEAAKTTADIFKDGFKQAGDSLTKDLATALRTGKGIMDSFKNYFNSALDSILQGLIEKNITQPLVNHLNGFIDKAAPTGELGSGMVRSMGQTLSSVNGTVSSWGSGLGSIFSSIFSNIGGLFQGFGSSISGFLGNIFGGGGGGGMFGSLFSGIGGLFSGGGFLGGIGSLLGFADGGYPPVNRPSIVGERGPELFVPTSAGRVVPNNELGGGSGPTTVVFELNAISTRDGVEFLLENKPAIIQMVQQASNKRGRAGILD